MRCGKVDSPRRAPNGRVKMSSAAQRSSQVGVVGGGARSLRAGRQADEEGSSVGRSPRHAWFPQEVASASRLTALRESPPDEERRPNAGPPTQISGPFGSWTCRAVALPPPHKARLLRLARGLSAFTEHDSRRRCRFHADIALVFDGAAEPIYLVICFSCSEALWSAEGLTCHLDMSSATATELRQLLSRTGDAGRVRHRLAAGGGRWPCVGSDGRAAAL